MKKQYLVIGITILSLVNYGCHSRYEKQATKAVLQDTLLEVDSVVYPEPTGSVIEDSAKCNTLDSAAVGPSDSSNVSSCPKSTKSRAQKNKISPKRKEGPKKGFTSIRAERRKQKSK